MFKVSMLVNPPLIACWLPPPLGILLCYWSSGRDFLSCSWIGGRLPQITFLFFLILLFLDTEMLVFLLHLSFLSLSECILLTSLIHSFLSSDSDHRLEVGREGGVRVRGLRKSQLSSLWLLVRALRQRGAPWFVVFVKEGTAR